MTFHDSNFDYSFSIHNAYKKFGKADKYQNSVEIMLNHLPFQNIIIYSYMKEKNLSNLISANIIMKETVIRVT